MDYKRDLYKCTGITTVADARAKRTEKLTFARQAGRMKLLDLKRGTIIDAEEEPINEKKKTRAEMLQAWKAEKQKKLEMSKTKGKPVFKVGVVHYKATGSPLTDMTNSFAAKNYMKAKPQVNKQKLHPGDGVTGAGVVTRARAKQMTQVRPVMKPVVKPKSALLKITSNKKQPVMNHPFVVPQAVSKLLYSQKITIPNSPKITKSARKSIKPFEYHKTDRDPDVEASPMVALEQKIKSMNTNEVDENPETLPGVGVGDVAVGEPIAPSVLPTSEREEQRKESLERFTSEFVPIHYSPYVNKTRGSEKKSAGKSKKILTFDEKIEQKIEQEEKEFQCRIFSHKKFLESETKRLLETCEEWSQLSSRCPGIPADVQGEIDAITGKTKLLTSDKFVQFRDLIVKCENKDPMIKIDDLQGFQDWVALEVERIDTVWYKLSQLRERGWREEQGGAKARPVPAQPSQPSQPAAAKAKKPSGVSSVRAHILAARQLMRQNAVDKEDGDLTEVRQLPTAAPPAPAAPALAKRRQSSLRKEVLTSENKRRNSGLEIVMATHIAKSLTPSKGGSTEAVSFINMELTPSRGILKASTPQSSATKRSVAFNLRHKPVELSERYLTRYQQNLRQMVRQPSPCPINIPVRAPQPGVKKPADSDDSDMERVCSPQSTPQGQLRRSSRLSAKKTTRC